MFCDAILRCLVPVRINGEIFEQIFHTVREGTDYLVVLEWSASDGNQTQRTPRQCVAIPQSEIYPVTKLSAEYELVSRTGIDFDKAALIDVAAVTNQWFLEPPVD